MPTAAPAPVLLTLVSVTVVSAPMAHTLANVKALQNRIRFMVVGALRGVGELPQSRILRLSGCRCEAVQPAYRTQNLGMRMRLIISEPDSANSSTSGCSLKPATTTSPNHS